MPRNGPDHLLFHMLQAARAGQDPNMSAEFWAGVQKYITWPQAPQRHTWTRSKKFGPATLYHIPAKGRRRFSPVLLIPSLINGPHIFDLTPDQSFAEYVSGRGFPVYILKWGNLTRHPWGQSLDGLLPKILGAAVPYIADLHRRPVIQMGYCMGGLLMAGALPMTVPCTSATVYLATPWDFHASTSRFTPMVNGWAPAARTVIHTHGVLPSLWMQGLFAAVDPEQTQQKFLHFAKRSMDDPAAGLFVAVEDWLQSGSDVPGAIATTILNDWYQRNLPGQGRWHVNGHTIARPVLAKIPSLLVVPRRDRLVEPDVAMGLRPFCARGSKVLKPDLGHIGLMSSPRAKAAVWEPLVDALAALQQRHDLVRKA